MLAAAVDGGHVELVKLLLDHFKFTDYELFYPSMLIAAIKNTEIFRMLFNLVDHHGLYKISGSVDAVWNEISTKAFAKQDLEIISLLVDSNKIKLFTGDETRIIESMFVEMEDHIFDIIMKYTSQINNASAFRFNWGSYGFRDPNVDKLSKCLISRNYVRLFKHFINNYRSIHEDVIITAVSHNSLDILRVILESPKYKRSTESYNRAVVLSMENKSYEIFEYLLFNRKNINVSISRSLFIGLRSSNQNDIMELLASQNINTKNKCIGTGGRIHNED
jgi:hypothetical protein